MDDCIDNTEIEPRSEFRIRLAVSLVCLALGFAAVLAHFA